MSWVVPVVERVRSDRVAYAGLLVAGVFGQATMWSQLLSFDPRAMSSGLAADAVFLTAAVPFAVLSAAHAVSVIRRIRAHAEYETWSRTARITAWAAEVHESHWQLPVYLQVLAFSTFYGLVTLGRVALVLGPLLFLASFLVGGAAVQMHRLEDPR